jgi:hypothetical protein
VSAFRPFLFPPADVFSRPPLAPQPNLCASGASSFLSITWRLLVSLCSLFRARFLYFHELAASFSKMPGVGGYSECNYRTPGGWVVTSTHATLCFRRHMRHVAPLSPVASLDCAYFLSPRGWTTLSVNFATKDFFSVPLWQIPFCLSFVFTTIRIAFPATPLFSQPSALPGGVGVCRQGFHRCQVRVARRTGI